MTVPGLPVFDPGDAEIYGWRVAPDREGNLIIEVIDGVGSIVFPPGGHLTHNGNGDIKARVVMNDLEGSVDQDGNAWLSSGGEVTDEKVSLTRNIRAIISRPAASCGGRAASCCTKASSSPAGSIRDQPSPSPGTPEIVRST
jgi:hypothetical protein